PLSLVFSADGAAPCEELDPVEIGAQGSNRGPSGANRVFLPALFLPPFSPRPRSARTSPGGVLGWPASSLTLRPPLRPALLLRRPPPRLAQRSQPRPLMAPRDRLVDLPHRAHFKRVEQMPDRSPQGAP